MTSVWLIIKTPHVLFTMVMSNIINVYINKKFQHRKELMAFNLDLNNSKDVFRE